MTISKYYSKKNGNIRVIATMMRRKQSGLALIAFLLVLVIGASVVLFRGLNAAAAQSYRDEQTARALAEAKTALIGYAVSDPSRPGELPCPDFNNDGKSQFLPPSDYDGSLCKTLRGWLPWFRLRLPDLRDGTEVRLWYGLSSSYRAGNSDALNSTVNGQLTVDGVSDVVAVVIAPHEPLPVQVGRPGADANLAVDDYLEGSNRDPTDKTQYATSGNDRLLIISRQELMAAVEKRVAGDLRNALLSYYASSIPSHFPYAAKFDDSTYNCKLDEHHGHLPIAVGPFCSGIAGLPLWFQPNDWHTVTYYAVAPSCTIANWVCAGPFLTVNNSPPPAINKQAVVIMAGQKLAGQARTPPPPPPIETDYLEGENGNPINDIFEKKNASPTFNDVVTIVAP